MKFHRGPDADLDRLSKEDITAYRCQGCGELKTNIAARIDWGWACCGVCFDIAAERYKDLRGYYLDLKNNLYHVKEIENNNCVCDVYSQTLESLTDIIFDKSLLSDFYKLDFDSPWAVARSIKYFCNRNS